MKICILFCMTAMLLACRQNQPKGLPYNPVRQEIVNEILRKEFLEK